MFTASCRNETGLKLYFSSPAVTVSLHPENAPETQAAAPAPVVWPEHKSEGWDLLDLSGIPLENPATEVRTRTELMNGGMLPGKGNAAVMRYLDFSMEEYIGYLQEHPHVALYVDGVLKYEICRQYVGNAESIDVKLTRNARDHVSSLANMGGVITVFGY